MKRYWGNCRVIEVWNHYGFVDAENAEEALDRISMLDFDDLVNSYYEEVDDMIDWQITAEEEIDA